MSAARYLLGDTLETLRAMPDASADLIALVDSHWEPKQ